MDVLNSLHCTISHYGNIIYVFKIDKQRGVFSQLTIDTLAIHIRSIESSKTWLSHNKFYESLR